MFTLSSNGLTLIKKQDLSESQLLNIASALSDKRGELTDKLLHWEFGPVMTMKHDPEAQNYLFSDEAVPFHWDGAFYKEPCLLLFYCLDSEGQGGETLFSNTELIWDSLSDDEKFLCQKITLTYETAKKAHYGGKITLPLVQQHPKSGKTILRLAEAVRTEKNPVTLKIEGTSSASEFYQWLKEKLYAPPFMTEHRWEKGDLLLADNFTYLHGRRALKDNKNRTFKRIQIL